MNQLIRIAVQLLRLFPILSFIYVSIVFTTHLAVFFVQFVILLTWSLLISLNLHYVFLILFNLT